MTTIGLGWVERDEDFLANLMRNELLNIVAGLPRARCVYLRSDKTTPQIAQADADPAAGLAPTRAARLVVLAGHGQESGIAGVKDMVMTRSTTRFGGETCCVVVVACAVLAGEEDSKYTDPKAWSAVFDGLHRLIAPNTFVTPSPGRGARFAHYLDEGYPFLEAWTRACEDSGSPLSQWRMLCPKEALAAPYSELGLFDEAAAAAPQGDFELVDLG